MIRLPPGLLQKSPVRHACVMHVTFLEGSGAGRSDAHGARENQNEPKYRHHTGAEPTQQRGPRVTQEAKFFKGRFASSARR